MATLQQTLQANKQKVLTRGPGGVLSEESPEEIQSLASKAGMQAPPITPAGAGMLGANPDQQKMMGTPAQKQAALSLATQPAQSLQDTLRRQQVRGQTTGEEKGSIQKSQDMQNLGTLGDRVNDFINGQRQLLQEQATKASQGQGVQVATSSEFKGKDVGPIKDLLAQLRANPGDQNTMLQVNQALGYDINRQLDPNEINQLYQSATDVISSGAAGVVDSDLNVDDLVNDPKFGYDKQHLAGLLGVPADQVGSMTVGQIRDQVNKAQAEEFSKTQQLEQQAQSGQLGQAERGLARGLAKEASRTGVRASEADVQHLESQIQNADQVQFAGQSYKIDDLLRDDTISGLIVNYLQSGPDSDIRRQIDQNEPQLRAFIEKNKTLLDSVSGQLSGSARQFQETQEANKRVANLGGIQLDEKLASAFIPNFGKLSASRVDSNSVPLLQYANSLPQDQQRIVAQGLNSTVARFPDSLEQFKGLSAPELANLQIGTPGGNIDRWVKNQEEAARVASIRPEDTNAIVNAYYGGSVSPEQIQGEAQKSKSLNTLGLPSSDIPTDSNSMLQKLKESLPQLSIKDVLSGRKAEFQPAQFQPNPEPQGVGKDLFNKLNDAAADGYVSGQELANSGLSLDESIYLMDNKGKGKMDYEMADRIFHTKQYDNTKGILDQASGIGDRSQQIQKLREELQNQGDKRVRRGMIEDRIKELEGQDAAEQANREATERENERKTQRQQNQIKTIFTGGIWAMLPPETQNALNNLGTDLSEGQLKQLKDTFEWSPTRTVPENLGILARNVGTLQGRSAQSLAQTVKDNAASLQQGAVAGAQNVGGQIASGTKKLFGRDKD